MIVLLFNRLLFEGNNIHLSFAVVCDQIPEKQMTFLSVLYFAVDANMLN